MASGSSGGNGPVDSSGGLPCLWGETADISQITSAVPAAPNKVSVFTLVRESGSNMSRTLPWTGVPQPVGSGKNFPSAKGEERDHRIPASWAPAVVIDQLQSRRLLAGRTP